MGDVTTIGLDIAKTSFQAHGADASGAVMFRKKLSRGRLLAFFAAQPPCLVVMETCSGAHHWGRELSRLGHTIRLIPPAYVKPFGASGLGEVNVTDTANASIDMMIRIANTVFSVEDILSATRLRVRRRWGSADVPIPMGVTGFGIFGATVYDVTPDNPTGGIESLPVVISTAPQTTSSISDPIQTTASRQITPCIRLPKKQ